MVLLGVEVSGNISFSGDVCLVSFSVYILGILRIVVLEVLVLIIIVIGVRAVVINLVKTVFDFHGIGIVLAKVKVKVRIEVVGSVNHPVKINFDLPKDLKQGFVLSIIDSRHEDVELIVVVVLIEEVFGIL